MVVPENIDAVRLCCATATQWRLAPSGRRIGLDYDGCATAARGMGVSWRETFDKLRIMEAALLAEWKE